MSDAMNEIGETMKGLEIIHAREAEIRDLQSMIDEARKLVEQWRDYEIPISYKASGKVECADELEAILDGAKRT